MLGPCALYSPAVQAPLPPATMLMLPAPGACTPPMMQLATSVWSNTLQRGAQALQFSSTKGMPSEAAICNVVAGAAVPARPPLPCLPSAQPAPLQPRTLGHTYQAAPAVTEPWPGPLAAGQREASITALPSGRLMQMSNGRPAGGARAPSVLAAKTPLSASAPEFVWAGKSQPVTVCRMETSSSSTLNHAAPEFLSPSPHSECEGSQTSTFLAAPDCDSATDEQGHPGEDSVALLCSTGCSMHPDTIDSSRAPTCMPPSGTLNAAAAEFVPSAASGGRSTLPPGRPHCTWQDLRLSSSAPHFGSMHATQQQQASEGVTPAESDWDDGDACSTECGLDRWHGVREDAPATWDAALLRSSPPPACDEQDPASGEHWCHSSASPLLHGRRDASLCLCPGTDRCGTQRSQLGRPLSPGAMARHAATADGTASLPGHPTSPPASAACQALPASSRTSPGTAREAARPNISNHSKVHSTSALTGAATESEHAHVSNASSKYDEPAAAAERSTTPSQPQKPILQRPQPRAISSQHAAHPSSGGPQPTTTPAQLQDVSALLPPSEWPLLPGASDGCQHSNRHAAGSPACWRTVVARNGGVGVATELSAGRAIQDGPSRGACSGDPVQADVPSGHADFAAGSKAEALFRQMGGSPQAGRMLRQLCCPITQACWR